MTKDRCAVCGARADVFGLLPLDVGERFLAGQDVEEEIQECLSMTRPELRRAKSALLLCRVCRDRMFATCAHYQRHRDRARRSEGLWRATRKAQRKGVTEERMRQIVGAYLDGATGETLMWMVDDAPAVGTGCRPEGGGEVIYLPSAQPRRRVRPEGQGAA